MGASFASVPAAWLTGGAGHLATRQKLCVAVTALWKTALQHWLDGSWATHPPTLHVLDTTRLLQRALEPLSRIRAVFEEYDTDGDGSISLEEMRSMVSELQLPELGLSQHQVVD